MLKKVYFLLFFISSTISAQWMPTEGLYGGIVDHLAATAQTVFAFTRAGVFTSSDYGLNWKSSNNGLAHYYFSSAAASPGICYVVENGSIFATTNEGESWYLINNGLPFPARSVAVNSNYSFCQTNVGIYRSSNNGSSWSLVYPGSSNSFYSLFASDSLLMLGGYFNLIISKNNGNTWQSLASSPAQVEDVIVKGKNIFVISPAGILKSSNNGISWLKVSNDTIDGGSSDVITSTDSTVIVGNSKGIFTSKDDGATWTRFNSYAGISFIIKDNIVFAGAGRSGVIASTDYGYSWQLRKNGISMTLINAMAAVDNLVLISYDYRLYRISDNENEWYQTDNAAVLPYTMTLASHDSVFYAGTWTLSDDSAGVYKSTDFGINWLKISSGIEFGAMGKQFAFNEDKIYLGTYEPDFGTENGHVYSSTDKGQSWTRIFNGWGNNGISTLYTSEKFLFASNRGLYRTILDSIYWHRLQGQILNSRINSIAGSEENLIASSIDGTFYSTDAGLSWSKIRNPQINLTNIFYSFNNNILAATYYGVYLSRDNGFTWQIFNDGLPGTVDLFTVTSKYIYAATKGGIFRRPLAEFIPVELISFTAETNSNDVILKWSTATEINNRGFEIERKADGKNWASVGFIAGKGTSTDKTNYQFKDIPDNSIIGGKVIYRIKQIDFDGTSSYSDEVSVLLNSVPEEFSVAQNYPNPFNPTTVIKYSVPVESRILFEISNSIGQKIKEEIFSRTPGNYEYAINLSGFASGVYIYSMKANSIDGKNNFISLKKMILIK